MEKRLRWFWRRGFDPSWRLDETYVKVRGKWTYLYRAVDKRGDTIDFYLSPTCSDHGATPCRSERRGLESGGPKPGGAGPEQGLRRRRGGEGRELPGRGGRTAGADRPQRRGEEHLLQYAERPDPKIGRAHV